MEKRIIVKAGNFPKVKAASTIDSPRHPSVQKRVPVIAAARFVSGISNERFNLPRV
jgi:hypothetical protein